MQTLAYGQEFLGGQIRRGIHFHFVRTQRSLALTLSRKRVKAFGDFRIQVSFFSSPCLALRVQHALEHPLFPGAQIADAG